MDAILGDVKTVTARVSEQTERVDHAIHGTMDRVDETAERVKDSVTDKVSHAVGVVRGVRAVDRVAARQRLTGTKPPAAAAGRA